VVASAETEFLPIKQQFDRIKKIFYILENANQFAKPLGEKL